MFFEKGISTKNIWFYHLNLERNLGKTDPLNEDDLAEFIKFQKEKKESENSWTIKVPDVNKETYNLGVKNPNTPEEAPLRQPNEIIEDMMNIDTITTEIILGRI